MQSLTNLFKNVLVSADGIDKMEEQKQSTQLIKLFESKVIYPVDKAYNEKMISIYRRIKKDLFDPLKFEYWGNVAICGGYATDLFYMTNNSSDIDIYIFGIKNQNKIDEIVKNIIKLVSGEITFETKAVMTLKTKSRKSVQIINTSNLHSIKNILASFDINICKVAFDGCQILFDESAIDELKNCTINYNNCIITTMTINRLAKYIHKKNFGLLISPNMLENLDPLYLFRDSNGFNKFMQLSKLLNDSTLQNIHKLLSLRVCFDFRALSINSMTQYDSEILDETLKGKALSSNLKSFELFDPTLYNKFGQPKLFELIKKGQYNLSDLYDQQIVDMCYFNVTCMVVLYEPDEQKIIDLIKNIHHVGSKNQNKYKLNYLHMACLFNRQTLVGFLMNESNYKMVMEIAVKEDNYELYKMAVATYNSGRDKYMYDKNTLLQYKAYGIYKELYENFESEDENFEDFLETHLEDQLKDMTLENFMIKYFKSNQKDQTRILSFLIKKCVKETKQVDKYMLEPGSMTEVENVLYKIYYDKINAETEVKYNRMLKNVVDEATYNKHIKVNFENPFKNNTLESRIKLIEIYTSKVLPNDYKFDDRFINELIIHLDDPTMIKDTPFKRLLIDNVLSRIDVKNNMKQYVIDHLRKTNDVTLYSQMIANTAEHDLAYTKSVLNSDYSRQENALGYTPCDIIIFQTMNDYYNNYGIGKNYVKDVGYSNKYLENRRKSVRNINRNKPILEYNEIPDKAKVVALLPELFCF